MERKRHITQPPCMTPWYALGSFFFLWFWYAVLCGRFLPEWTDHFLVKWLGVMILSILIFYFHRIFLWGDVVLTEGGIRCCRRFGSSFLPWDDVIQVCAIRYSTQRILVLLKKGGVPMKEGNDHLWFFLRNPRKVIFLPDDKFIRAFVAAYYGAIDIREQKDSRC